MVKTQGLSDYDRLDALINELCTKHGFKLSVEGWTRKTYNVLSVPHKGLPSSQLLARIESFATANGEVRVFDDRAMQFAEELGKALEETFSVGEATVLRVPRPD